jgi:hypothetical protein
MVSYNRPDGFCKMEETYGNPLVFGSIQPEMA